MKRKKVILMSTIEKNKKMKKLIDTKTIVPGIFREEDGVKLYEPISEEQYEQMIESGNFENRIFFANEVY